MALTPSSSSAAGSEVEPVVPESQTQVQAQSKKKRTTDPGVRTKGSRTYDSANGTTCHQCRQKTTDFAAVCKNWKVKDNKPCTLKLCLKCLQNRYGEKAEEVALLTDWHCPKCRGICNCSFCMKKRGQKPTGILVHTAKKSGFSSVSEMLNVGDADNLNGANLDSVTADPDKKRLHEVNPNSKRKGSKRPKLSKESSGKEVGNDAMDDDASLERDASLLLDLSERSNRHKVSIDGEILQETGMSEALDQDDAGAKLKPKRGRPKKAIEDIEHEEVEPDIPLPQGSDLTTIAGIDLPSDSVGQALQFLEFCSAFGEALELRKGRAESVLREVIQGKDRRRCQYSSTVQFHIQLLTLILEDLGEDSSSLNPEEQSPSSSPKDGGNSWLEAFRKCISESDVPTDTFPVNLDNYGDLDRLEKLRLLNFLCDEALGTNYLRDSIDDQITKLLEKKKETHQKVATAKEKEKRLKQKLNDEVATTIIANKAPLSLSEHEAIVAQTKDELALARAELAEARDSLPNKTEKCAAQGTEPLFVDENGRAFWKLNCPEVPDLLLQDLGTWEAIGSKEEKWMTYNPEQKPEVEKYISFKKLKSFKRKREQEAAVPILAGGVEEQFEGNAVLGNSS